jgi:hypothetical protein
MKNNSKVSKNNRRQRALRNAEQQLIDAKVREDNYRIDYWTNQIMYIQRNMAK